VQTAVVKRLVNPDAVGRTEADIQSDIKVLLLGGEFELDAPRLEEQLADGSRRRIDIGVGATVLEVKRTLVDGAADDEIAQLAGYVQARVQQTGGRYNGILTNGRLWWLFEFDPATEEFQRRSVFELTHVDRVVDLIAWLQAVLATHSNVMPSQRTIEELLGSSSPAYAQDIAYLQGLYRQVADDPTVQLKRDLWARLLRSALGTGFEDHEQLFLDHTLLVIEAAIIGHGVMDIPLQELTSQPETALDGGIFRDADIYNVVESDFFDWVLSAEHGRAFIRHLIRRIAAFNWHNVEHDVLKVLYESIIHPTTRKNMGEYYTPDWLAEGIVTKAVTKPLEQKVLDPACGSGTFIFHTVRHIINAATEAGWENRKIVSHLEEHVFGLDLHPVSVLLARVTYLMALGDVLRGDRSSIWVPIHLGDSMQWSQPSRHEENSIRIKTHGADMTAFNPDQGELFSTLADVLVFPLASIDDPGTFDSLVTDLTNQAKECTADNPRVPSIRWIFKKYGILDQNDIDTLTETFQILCDLHKRGRDSIWGYFVRNLVRPLWLSMKSRRVDVLVGNPPWVAYRFMTPDMQEQFQEFSKLRNLWHGKKLSTHQDLVGLFIVRTIEKYLKDEGTFAFVTPLALLSRQQYEGFRAGIWGDSSVLHLRGEITEMWDLDKVRPHPFPVPAGVIYGVRHTVGPARQTDKTSYGAPDSKVVIEGLRDLRGWTQSLENFTFTTEKNFAISDAAVQSPYRVNVTQGAILSPRMLVFVREETATNPLGQSVGRVSVTSHRTSQEKDPWKSTPSLSGVMQRRYIFDAHLGSTIAPFRKLEPWRAVLPISDAALMDETQMKSQAPGLAKWWSEANAIWEENKTKSSQLSFLENLDYQSKLLKQLGGVKHRVVYSSSGTALAAAHIDDPNQIIDTTLYWLPVRSREEAQYLVAILNAPATTRAVSHLQSRGLFGARHFHTYVWRLPIPTYDPTQEAHCQLVELAQQAEDAAAEVEIDGIGFQRARRLIRDMLEDQGIAAQLDLVVKELMALDV
jgi:hypothetical protein